MSDNNYSELQKALSMKRPKLSHNEKKLLFEYTSFLDKYNPTLSERYWYVRNGKKELVTCPICGNKVPYNNHKCKVGIYCSEECSNMDRDERLKRQVENNIKNYGVKYLMHTDENKEKSKKAIKDKYGVNNVMQVEDIKLKSMKTREPNYDKIIKKSRKTMLERYGVDHPMKNQEIKDRIKNTVKDKYGVDNVMKNKDIAKKLSNTNTKKSFQNLDSKWRKLASKYSILLTPEDEFYEASSTIRDDNGDRYLYRFKCKKCGRIFESSINSSGNVFIKCPICYPHSLTLIEELFNDILEKYYTGKVIKFYRDVYEIDFYLPELNIGFEIDCLYWHSEEKVDKNYHLDKFNYFKEKGIRIYNIFEDEIIYKYDILVKKVKHILGLNENLPKIYARKCYVKEISSKTKNKFLNKNHIQGEDKSSVKLGLFTNDSHKLVSVMTFGIARKSLGYKNDNSETIELVRFANSNKYIVLGSFGKLLKYFKDNYEYDRIITYADLRWSDGDIYFKNGFSLLRVSKPSYWYVKIHNNKSERFHRYNFRKQKLLKEYPKYENLTEQEIMKILGYTRIWDCGNLVFEYK